MWPFRRKSKYPSSMERGLEKDKAAMQYRTSRILLIAFQTEKSFLDAEELADKWLVQTVMVAVGDDDPQVKFIPHPIWDDEWMLHRSAFDTREEAFDYVATSGGSLLVPRD